MLKRVSSISSCMIPFPPLQVQRPYGWILPRSFGCKSKLLTIESTPWNWRNHCFDAPWDDPETLRAHSSKLLKSPESLICSASDPAVSLSLLQHRNQHTNVWCHLKKTIWNKSGIPQVTLPVSSFCWEILERAMEFLARTFVELRNFPARQVWLLPRVSNFKSQFC